jgi:hypothetical protein
MSLNGTNTTYLFVYTVRTTSPTTYNDNDYPCCMAELGYRDRLATDS